MASKKTVWVLGGVFFYLLFRASMAQARGVRNNNPGNIRKSPGTIWNGQIGTDEKGFVRFDSKANGLRAATITALHYFTKDGVRTLEQFGARWAPPSDNKGDTSYGRRLATQLGVNPMLAFDYRNRLADLVKAITNNEGNQALGYTTAEFKNAAISATTGAA